MKENINTNVLVIDDEEIVRDNIEEILVPRRNNQEFDNISIAASVLFDTEKPILSNYSSNIPNFVVSKASNGMEGLARVKQSLDSHNPFAVIFLDMRMPGWDGLETALEIRKFDSRVEIIFVTAYSDKSIDEIVAQVGQNIGYHCKPYASEEIIQLATKAVSDYNKLRNLEKLIEVISSTSLNEIQLNSLLRNILDQLATYIETDMALLGKLHDDFSYEKVFSIGALEEKVNLQDLIEKVKNISLMKEEIVQFEEIVLMRMDDYTIFAILKRNQKLKTEKLYLLKLFVQNAARAIRNAELHEKLLQKEKLTAIGSALGMVMHDLRSPIKSIKIFTDQLRKENVQSGWLDLIDVSSNQASEIFDDFLDFIKETNIEKQPLSLNKIIEDATQPDEDFQNKGVIPIHKNFHQDILVSGDESKLRRVIANIVRNAMDSLYDNKVANPAIEIDASANADLNQLTITISDNGPGIPIEIQKNIFEPFVTRKKKNGTGLGLAIVHQFVHAHQGEISVRNNNGAIFTIVLPWK